MADGLGRCRLLTSQILQNELLPSITYVLTDCDGVLWSGNNAIPGSSETLNVLRKLGKKVRYVTNNSSKSRQGYVEKCKKLNFDTRPEDIFTTAYCAVLYLKKIKFSGKIYLIGSKDFLREIVDGGFTVCGSIGPDPVPNEWLKWAVEEMAPDKEVKAVVVGFDEHMGFMKCMRAASYLKDPNCLFLATNTDETYPCPNKNIVVPGTGTIVAAVSTAAQRKPIVLGKPEPFMTDCIRFRCPDLDPVKTVMIGDRLNTDILMGRRAGMKTILVGTGVHNLDDVRHHVAEGKLDDVPDFFLPKLGDIVDMLLA
ncbi:unnamed protein product [Ixodes hexagonus]